MQKQFKRDLQNNIKILSADIRELAEDYNISGPMVPGIKPLEAVDRLRRFKVFFFFFGISLYFFTNLFKGVIRREGDQVFVLHSR